MKLSIIEISDLLKGLEKIEQGLHKDCKCLKMGILRAVNSIKESTIMQVRALENEDILCCEKCGDYTHLVPCEDCSALICPECNKANENKTVLCYKCSKKY